MLCIKYLSFTLKDTHTIWLILLCSTIFSFPLGRKSNDAPFSSTVASVSSLILKHDVMVLIWAPDSETEDITMNIIETVLQKMGGGNVRYIRSLNDFKSLDKDVKTFLVFDNEATNQNFFCERNISSTVQRLQHAKEGKDVHSLIFIPSEMKDTLIKSLKTSSLKYEVLCFNSLI